MSEQKNSTKKIILPSHVEDSVPCRGVCVVADPGAIEDDAVANLSVVSVTMDFETSQGKDILPIDIKFNPDSGNQDIAINKKTGKCKASEFYGNDLEKEGKSILFYRYVVTYKNTASRAKVAQGEVTATSVSWMDKGKKTSKTKDSRDKVKINRKD